MPISADDHARVALGRSFEHAVVGGVVGDVYDLFDLTDDHDDAQELGNRLFGVRRFPGELLGQDPPELAEQGRGGDEGEPAAECTR
jgi:hypothetical protein